MRRWGSLLFVAMSQLFVSACSTRAQNANDFPSFEVPVLDADRRAFLEEFPLLDSHGLMKPPVATHAATAAGERSRDVWPLGALIYMPPSGRGGFCSVSHIASGKIVANAHCVQADARPYNYFVVYYDVRGEKTYDRIKAIDYQGNSAKDDVAVLSLTKTDDRRWHVLNGKILPTQSSVGLQPPVSNSVTVWAFNPTAENHPELVLQYGNRPGMKFSPRTCTVSRTVPRVVGLTYDSEGNVTQRDPVRARADENLHLFVDDCSERMVKGNSGSLISESNNLGKVLGVYHWVVQTTTRYSAIEYQGNSGATVVRSADETAKNGIFGVGTAFEAAFEDRPALLTFFQNWALDFSAPL